MPLHVSSTTCSSSGGQNYVIFDLLMMGTWCSKHVEAWNKLIVKQKFCATGWLITKINILRWCYINKLKPKNYVLAKLVFPCFQINETWLCTRWFKYDRDWCRQIYTQTVPVIFEPPCSNMHQIGFRLCLYLLWGRKKIISVKWLVESPVVCIWTLIRSTWYKRPHCKRKNIFIPTCIKICPGGNIFILSYSKEIVT